MSEGQLQVIPGSVRVYVADDNGELLDELLPGPREQANEAETERLRATVERGAQAEERLETHALTQWKQIRTGALDGGREYADTDSDPEENRLYAELKERYR